MSMRSVQLPVTQIHRSWSQPVHNIFAPNILHLPIHVERLAEVTLALTLTLTLTLTEQDKTSSLQQLLDNLVTSEVTMEWNGPPTATTSP